MTQATETEVKLMRLKIAFNGDEIKELRALLVEAHEVVCGAQCRSLFPAGHVKSNADHSELCRRLMEQQ